MKMLCLSAPLLLTLVCVPLRRNSLFHPLYLSLHFRSRCPVARYLSPLSHPQRSISSIRSRSADCCIIYPYRGRGAALLKARLTPSVSPAPLISPGWFPRHLCVCVCASMCICIFVKRLQRMSKWVSEVLHWVDNSVCVCVFTGSPLQWETSRNSRKLTSSVRDDSCWWILLFLWPPFPTHPLLHQGSPLESPG